MADIEIRTSKWRFLLLLERRTKDEPAEIPPVLHNHSGDFGVHTSAWADDKEVALGFRPTRN